MFLWERGWEAEEGIWVIGRPLVGGDIWRASSGARGSVGHPPQPRPQSAGRGPTLAQQTDKESTAPIETNLTDPTPFFYDK